MKISSFVLAVIGTFGTFASGAVADPLAPRPYMAAEALPPYEVINIVRASGFRPLSSPVLRGRAYVLRAIEPDGDDVRIAVDSSSGRIVSVVPIDTMPGYGAASTYEPAPTYEPASPYDRPDPYRPGPYHYGAPEPLTNGREPYAPPREAAPAPRPIAPIGRSAAVTPPRTPLPRPRPTDAVVASPSDVKITAPEPVAQPSPPQAAAANKDGAGQEHPAQAPAEKPAATTLPPVAPLD